MADYIPDEDETFNQYASEQFAPYAAANAAALGVPEADITALQALLAAWQASWSAFGEAERDFRSAVQDKDAKRAGLEARIRTIAGKVQADPAVTDAQKEALGITVRKTTRTPAPIPSTPPTLQKIDTSTRAILRLFIADSATPDSRAKPAGVQSCEIRQQVGGTAPTDPETMAFLASETRPPYRADFDAEEVGKIVYFALRWVNTRGKPGPWSQIFSVVVPS
jgi:hypothetical protein